MAVPAAKLAAAAEAGGAGPPGGGLAAVAPGGAGPTGTVALALPAGTGQLLVAHAERGVAHLLPASPDDSVLGLKGAVELATGVEPNYQILLLEGERLENDASLGEYGLPPPAGPRSRPVYLFSRRSLNRATPLPEPPELAPDELPVPEALPDALAPRRPTSLASPLVRALVDYERHFALHLLQARALHEGGGARLAAARAALASRELQSRALGVAVLNLRLFASKLSDR